MKVDLKIFLILILYFFTSQMEIFILMLFFIFIHELGHLFSGIVLGLEVKRISVTFVGFQIEFDSYNKNKILNSLIIDIAGPFVNFIFVIIGEVINNEACFYSNLSLMILNLLTIYPLDGGRILKNLLLYKFEYKKTIDIVNYISNITIIILTFISSIVILYLKNIAILFIITYLWYLIYIENKKKALIDRAYKTIRDNT